MRVVEFSMSNIFDMETDMPSLSYQEKSLYASLVAYLIIYVPYFFLVQHQGLSQIVAVIVTLIVLQIILQSVIAAFSRHRLTDERDRLIALRGYRAGYITIVGCIVLGLGALWLHTALGQLNPAHMAIHFLNVFFFFLVVAEIVKTVSQLVAYRRSI